MYAKIELTRIRGRDPTHKHRRIQYISSFSVGQNQTEGKETRRRSFFFFKKRSRMDQASLVFPHTHVPFRRKIKDTKRMRGPSPAFFSLFLYFIASGKSRQGINSASWSRTVDVYVACYSCKEFFVPLSDTAFPLFRRAAPFSLRHIMHSTFSRHRSLSQLL